MPAEPEESTDQEQTAVRKLLSENQRLKQRVFELEERLRKLVPQGDGHSGTGSAILKLIEHKDFQLQQAAARLEEKKEQLSEAGAELEKRTEELSRWADSLRLYQEIFDNDASAMIGVNREARVILFNRNAPQILGEKFRSALHRSVDDVDWSAFDPNTPRRVREAIAARKPVDSSIVVRDRRILTSITPIGSEAESRGALIRIQVQSAK
jgi:PAS domain-containing protein